MRSALTACLALSAGTAAAAALPTDAELEAAHARIGTITLRVGPIFDLTDPREDKALFRLADRLHVDTRESALRAHLLFQSGDLYSRRVLEETARNLRDLRYIREPQVRPIAFHEGLVDVEILATDVWSTTPGASFGRSGGANSSGFEFEELNLLGFGKQVSLGFKDTVDRSSYIFKWHDPGIWGTRWRDTVAITNSDDGQGYQLELERPFFSLDSRWSAGLSALQDEGIDHFYRLGESAAAYRRNTHLFDAHFGWSHGLRGGWARRWIAGVRVDSSDFSAVPGELDPPLIPDNRRLAYPYLRFEAVQDDFATVKNRDQIARTEDLCFGTHYALELGWSDAAFGADRTAAILSAQASRGLRLGEDRSLFLSSSISGRLENGSPTDTRLAGQVRYYRPTSARTLFFAELSGVFGSELDLDHELTLDGETGLRGYPLRYQQGSSRALLTLEERVFTNWSLWHIANVGGAVFVDAGRTWGRSAADSDNLGMLTDVGFGLRLGSSRSALANVVHLDVAFPLGANSSLSNVQFLVQTKKSF